MVAEILNDLVSNFGLLGLFIAAIIANATIFLPLPIDLIVFVLGGIDFLGIGLLSPILAGLVVGAGAAIGEISGYIIGLAGIKGAEKLKKTHFKKIEGLRSKIENKGMVFIALAALTPFPFDLVGIAAGLIKYDVKKFFLAALVGKVARYVIIAVAGYLSIETVKVFFGIA